MSSNRGDPQNLEAREWLDQMNEKERRHFSKRQRQVLLYASAGLCQVCHAPLRAGWHADHVLPHCAGGATDVINGQALCPRCNLRKGTMRNELWGWQQESLDRFNEVRKRQDSFFLVATPGAGKTFAVLAMVKELMEHDANRVVIIVPTVHLCAQWEKEARRWGIHLCLQKEETSDFHGQVLTYQAVSTSVELQRKLCAQRRTVVVFDEIHHGAITRPWGDCLREGFSPAIFKIAASGTPYRSDTNQIPFLRYEEGRSVPDFSYSYKQAIIDSKCRCVFFPKYEGDLQWYKDGQSYTHCFADDVTEDVTCARLRVALDPSSRWIQTVIQDADRKLADCRELGHHDAGGLILAMDQDHAAKLAAIVYQATRTTPIVATSDIPGASDKIKEFKEGQQRWLIAVRMVSEGVDIPRLRVLVYATNVLTPLFFQQAVGRVVRMVKDLEDQCAHVFIPEDHRLVNLARAIQEEREHALDEEDLAYEEERERSTQEEAQSSSMLIVDEGIARPNGGIEGGTLFSEEELHRASDLMRRHGFRGEPHQMVRLLREQANTSQATPSSASQQDEPSRNEERTKFRNRCNKLTSVLAHRIGVEEQEIHRMWKKDQGGAAQGTATREELQRKIGWLQQMLDGGAR